MNKKARTMTCQKREIRRLRRALRKIATRTEGIHKDWIDWGTVGRNSVFEARVALKPNKCVCCGKRKA